MVTLGARPSPYLGSFMWLQAPPLGKATPPLGSVSMGPGGAAALLNPSLSSPLCPCHTWPPVKEHSLSKSCFREPPFLLDLPALAYLSAMGVSHYTVFLPLLVCLSLSPGPDWGLDRVTQTKAEALNLGIKLTKEHLFAP